MAFRLARVLRLRTQLRRQTQDEVAQLAAALGAVRREIAELGARQRAVRAEEEAALPRGLAAADLEARRRYEAELLARAAALAAGRARLVERRREERQLERLAERAAARTAEAVARAEGVALDDLARRRR